MYDIIINNKNDGKEIYLLENGILVERIKEQKNIEGNIYLGKVQNVLPGMQAAFVDIGENKNAFIHLKDVLPKIDETKQKQQTNKNIKDIIKPGMKLLVQVKRAESNKKGAKVSTHISLNSRYLVLMPNTSIITVSQKIEDKKEARKIKRNYGKNTSTKHRSNYSYICKGKKPRNSCKRCGKPNTKMEQNRKT